MKVGQIQIAKSSREVAENIGVSIKYITDKQELFDYINSKDDNTRYKDKIKRNLLYSHGLATNGGTISLGYNYSSEYNTSLNIDKNDIKSICGRLLSITLIPLYIRVTLQPPAMIVLHKNGLISLVEKHGHLLTGPSIRTLIEDSILQLLLHESYMVFLLLRICALSNIRE